MRPAFLGFVRALALLAVSVASAAPAYAASADSMETETPEFWLSRAADPANSPRVRSHAEKRILMLADTSASILIAELQNPEAGNRRQIAARVLGKSGAPGAEAALLSAAFGADYFLAETAATALAGLYSRLDDQTLQDMFRLGGRSPGSIPGGAGAAEEDWLALSLREARAKERFRGFVLRGVAAKYAGRSGAMPPGLLECVWQALNATDRDLAASAVLAAGKSSSSQAPERLAAFLYTETNPDLLLLALRALAGMRPAEHEDAALRHTAHAEAKVCLEALAALDAMGVPGALFPAAQGMRSVAGYVTHPSTPVRRRAIEILGESKNPAALDYLLPALQDRVGQNRAAAVRALRKLGFSAAVGGVTPILRDGWPEARSEAALALHEMGVVGVAERVLSDLSGKETALPFRRVAAQTLGALGEERAMPALLEALLDDDLELACLAAEALAQLKDRRAGAGLYAVMTAGVDEVLSDAARQALSAIYLDDPGITRSGQEEWARRNGVAGNAGNN